MQVSDFIKMNRQLFISRKFIKESCSLCLIISLFFKLVKTIALLITAKNDNLPSEV